MPKFMQIPKACAQTNVKNMHDDGRLYFIDSSQKTPSLRATLFWANFSMQRSGSLSNHTQNLIKLSRNASAIDTKCKFLICPYRWPILHCVMTP